MLDPLIEYIRHYIKLSNEAKEDLSNSFLTKTYSKDEFIHREGHFCQFLYFILEGTVRTFYNGNGKEVTTWIYPNHQFVTAWSSYLLGTKSFESIQSLGTVKVLCISKHKLEELYKKHNSIETFGRKLVEEQLSSLDSYSKGYMFLTAKEKYDNLLSIFPDVNQRANLGHIASMLGISQETLSRIRGKKN
ncbi:Crp/Fnr family transcriptional regulator [uncultured Roseivirga sp.]|uniref:Crp/Fnr family transcriptional regulator n=1 Tax=uncultured Roseivirga sp. TaxID=543088 RepID=UPI000D79CC95|nr:Crp/Fnr family transcriptional regulator [uncultured Roseivirga sp.]PWL31917.1 MAG: hypothetical protein DCO95_01655 [Roseivirga sp. XM-24bin3]